MQTSGCITDGPSTSSSTKPGCSDSDPPAVKRKNSDVINFSMLEDMTFGDMEDQDFEMFLVTNENDGGKSSPEDGDNDDNTNNKDDDDDDDNEEGEEEGINPYSCEDLVIEQLLKDSDDTTTNSDQTDHENLCNEREVAMTNSQRRENCDKNETRTYAAQSESENGCDKDESESNMASSVGLDKMEKCAQIAKSSGEFSDDEKGEEELELRDSDSEDDANEDHDPYSSNNYVQLPLICVDDEDLVSEDENESEMDRTKVRKNSHVPKVEIVDVDTHGRVFRTRLVSASRLRNVIEQTKSGRKKRSWERAIYDDDDGDDNDNDYDDIEGEANEDVGQEVEKEATEQGEEKEDVAQGGDLLQAAMREALGNAVKTASVAETPEAGVEKPRKKGRWPKRVKLPEPELPIQEMFECDQCDKSFIYESEFKAHKEEHQSTSSEKFTCRICHQSYPKLKYLRTHMRSHIGKSTYSCRVCGKAFNHSWELSMHSRVHSGQGALDSTSLVRHAVTAIQEKKYYCNKCGRGFNIIGLYKDHMTVHTIEADKKGLGMRENQCPICGEQLPDEDEYSKHMEEHSRPAQCSLCMRQCKNMHELKAHMDSHHGGQTHLCQYCGLSFNRSKTYQVHCNKVHGDRRPFPCSLCKKTFSTISHVRRHIQRHTGERRLKCLFCANSYTCVRSLKIHMYKNHREDFQRQFVNNKRKINLEKSVIPANEAELAQEGLVNGPQKTNSQSRGGNSRGNDVTGPDVTLLNGSSSPEVTSAAADSEDELFLDPDLLVVDPELLSTPELQNKVQILD